jgi:hypothetical protein
VAETARMLWLLSLPGLTAEILKEEAGKLGMLSTQMLGIRETEWLSLRNACASRVGIADVDQWEREQIAKSPAYTRWLGDLRRRTSILSAPQEAA